MKKPVFQWMAVMVVLASALPPGWAMARRPPAAAEAPAPQLPPLTLKEAFLLSLERSETLAMKQADIDAAWADFLRATGEAFGDVNFKIEDFRQQSQQQTFTELGPSATGTLLRSETRKRYFSITQPLFTGFRSFGALSGAGSLRRERTYTRQRAEELLFLDVATSFYNVLRYEKDVEINKKTVSLFEERIQDLTEREKIGRSRESEIASALSRKKTLEADLAETKGDLAAERRVLEFLTGISLEGRPLQEESQAVPSPENLDTYLPSAAERSDVMAAREAKSKASRAVIVAQSELWPDISLESNLYERREGTQAGIDWDLLLTIDVPLTKGGTTFGEIKKALAERKKAKLKVSESERLAEMEIKQAYDGWVSSQERIRALEEAVKASERNYELQKEEYSRNLVNNLDVLAALESLNDSRVEADRAYFDSRINFWKLRIAAGKCCAEEEMPE